MEQYERIIRLAERHPVLEHGTSDINNSLHSTASDLPNEGYGIYGETWIHHLLTFSPVLDKKTSRTFFQSHSRHVIVDAFGPGGVIRDLIKRHAIPFELGIALSLGDDRDVNVRKWDKENNIHYISGNAFSPDNIQQVKNVLKQHNLTLFIFRPYAGIEHMPLKQTALTILFYKSLLDMIYESMSPGGMMLLQFDYDWKDDLLAWTAHQGLDERHVLCNKCYNSKYFVAKICKPIDLKN